MGFISERRVSDSPYIETVTRGYTEGSGSTIRPAESGWHMVVLSLTGRRTLLVVGPLTSSGVLSFGEGAELLWIKFKLGVYMPHLPLRDALNRETPLPVASGQSFWLNGSAWQYPDFENADTFVGCLARGGGLFRDPVIEAALQDQPPDLSPRTLRHRFLNATGQTQIHIRQMHRAQQAAERLQNGAPIVDTVFDLGYFDQPHLTRSLKRWIGYTPAQLLPAKNPA